MSMWEGALLTLFVLVSTSACVLVFMVFGWYVVWRCFLSKFRFLRELVGDRGAQMPEEPVQPIVEPSSERPARRRTRQSPRVST
uniref:small integral membrane protein 13 n=1 Tax=Myxine glutinosa TaxID=7769 RepID=UPI00358EA689